jgi:predicted dehydrogenase
MLRFGFIGCGGIIERRHLPGLLERSDVAEIAAVADVSADRLAVVAEKAGVAPEHRYADAGEMLSKETLDVVIVALPLAFHEAPVIAAAGRVPAILVEKPLAPNVRQAEAMMEACEREGTRLGVVHNQLFRPAVEAAATAIRAGAIGTPFLYRDELLGAGHRVGTGLQPDWRTNMAQGGGGCLIDSGYHSVYTAEHLIGKPVRSVMAQVAAFTHDYDVEDTAIVTMRHDGGALSSIQASWAIVAGRGVAQRVFELHADAGSMRFEDFGERLSVHLPGKPEPDWPGVAAERPDDAGYYAFRDRFLEAVEAGTPLPVTAEDGQRALAIVEAAYESARTGRAVEVGA